MLKKRIIAVILFTAIASPVIVFAQQTATAPTNDAIEKIKSEEFNHSQVMPTIRYLCDVIGARLTNSPAQRRASRWTKEQFEKMELQNVALDPWGEFGRGWEIKSFSAAVISPEFTVLRAYPKAWSPSTPGAVTGEVVLVEAKNESELEKYKGKLKGAIVLMTPERNVQPGFEPTARRFSDQELKVIAEPQSLSQIFQPPAEQTRQEAAKRVETAAQFEARKFRFYHEEGAAVLIDAGYENDFGHGDAGMIRVMGANVPSPDNYAPEARPVTARSKNAPAIVPQIVAEVEQYNRLYRLIKHGARLKMTINLKVRFYDDDLTGYNTVAEITGTDLKDEIVMIGAHLDSWHGGTGATDNAAGVAVVMEAMRILRAVGLKPRRTIRVALWTGEEQGLFGSRGYLMKNFIESPDLLSEAVAAEFLSGQKITIKKKLAFDKFSVYYNLDNGTGRVRGVYLQNNESVRPIFRKWLEPFREMGASTLTIDNTGGTDHIAFDAIGLPGFQFIQDPIEYSTRTWHTTQDVSDRILEEDLRQSAIIMAAFAYNSAMANEKLPRKTIPNLSYAMLFTGFDRREKFEHDPVLQMFAK